MTLDEQPPFLVDEHELVMRMLMAAFQLERGRLELTLGRPGVQQEAYASFIRAAEAAVAYFCECMNEAQHMMPPPKGPGFSNSGIPH